MNILLNGQPLEIPDDFTLANLVESRGLSGRRLAVEVNREVVPRSRYPQHPLNPNDRVEIVHAIGGG